MGIKSGMKARKERKQNKVPGLLGVITAIVLIIVSGINTRAALENEKAEGTRSVHMQDSQIEPATLVIGSHLIHINGLTDELYATAVESANTFNQSQMYYKSEIAGGAWFEISEAVSIADITTAGNPINKSVIEALEFTHKTGADGVTIDLCNGQTVSVFDINNPYDLNALEELEPLRIQHQILQEKTDKNESDEIYLIMLQSFFGKDIQSDRTRECDASLSGLEAYKAGLASREKPSVWVEKTEKIMTSVDAERRVISLTKLAEYLDELENSASGMGESNTQNVGDEENPVYVTPEFNINSDIVKAVGECIKNVGESISAYEAKRMSDTGETTSARLEYRYSQELIGKAEAKDTPGCDEIMEKLCDLQNILDGVVSNQDRELDTLTSDLVSAAFQKYAEDLRAGVSQAYQMAQSDGASQAILSKHLADQKTIANADRLEYQTMLDAQFQRMESNRAQQYTLELIDGVPQLELLIQQDAAKSYLEETVAEHLAWLRKEYAELVKNDSDGTEMSKLEKEKEILSKQRQDALDENNLSEAERLTAEMEAKQKEIDELLKRLNDILNSPNSSEADKAKARAGMGNGNAAARISQMADNLASDIRGNGADLQNQLAALNAIAQLEPEAGLNALQQVQDALDGATELDTEAADDMKNALSEALTDVRDAKESQEEGLSAEALENLLDGILSEILGTSFAKATSAQQSAAILAMEWYGKEMASDEAQSVAAVLTKQSEKAGSPFIYSKYSGKKEAYISLQTLGKVLAHRYIFDNKHNCATLQKSKEYYVFTLGRKEYQMAGQVEKVLGYVPEFMRVLYLHGNDSEKIFNVKAEYIQKTEYGIAGTPQVETLAKEIYSSLLEGGA